MAASIHRTNMTQTNPAQTQIANSAIKTNTKNDTRNGVV